MASTTATPPPRRSKTPPKKLPARLPPRQNCSFFYSSFCGLPFSLKLALHVVTDVQNLLKTLFFYDCIGLARPRWGISSASARVKLELWSRKLENSPRYLALDVGNRRIGVAVSDELGLTAQPVLTLERRHNRREDLRSLARLARRFAVVGIVVGNPLHMSGELSPQAVKTQAFAAELGELTGLPIHLWDERLTSHQAHQILYEAGHARQEHRHVVDQVAATLILQSFMDDKAASSL
jgi:putative Holliday junction resolvase